MRGNGKCGAGGHPPARHRDSSRWCARRVTLVGLRFPVPPPGRGSGATLRQEPDHRRGNEREPAYPVGQPRLTPPSGRSVQHSRNISVVTARLGGESHHGEAGAPGRFAQRGNRLVLQRAQLIHPFLQVA